MDVFVVSPSLSFINCTFPHESTISDLIKLFSPGKGVSCLDYYVKKNGRLSGGEERLQAGAVYRLEPRLCGGKGGFGSMLRALGAQIEKTTNREACRDLSGRRLRDVNHEKEMAEWLKKQTDRDAEKEQRRLEKIRRKLATPKRSFLDAEFDQQCHDLSERLEDSVLKGMQASSSSVVQAEDKPSRKRPATKATTTSSKKNCFWTGLEGVEDMDSTDEESEAEGFSPSQSCSSSSSSGAGPSSVSQPAAIPKTTAREQENAESQDCRSCSSSSSSSSSSAGSAPCSPAPCSPAPCSPPPSQENAEEKEEPVETAQNEEEEHSETTPKEKENTQSISNQQKIEKDDNVESTDPQKVPPEDAPLDLLSVSKPEELEAVGLERLKAELMKRGMKCGGTLQERAARLFSVRALTDDQIDPVLLAKPSKGKKK